MNNFTQREQKKLISLVSQNTVIYNTKLSDYSNKKLKDNLWDKIAYTLKKTSESCKREWKNMRDSYVRYKRTHNLSLLNSSTKKPRNWITYKMLGFLDNFVAQGTRKGRSQKNIKTIKINDLHQHEFEDIQNKDEPLLETNEYNLSDSDNHQNMIASSTSQTEQNQQNVPVSVPSHMKPYWKDDSTTILDSSQDDVPHKNLLNSKNSVDDIESFSIYVKDVLKMLPPMLQIKAKQEVFTVLSNFQIMVAKEGVSTSRDNIISIKLEIEDT